MTWHVSIVTTGKLCNSIIQNKLRFTSLDQVVELRKRGREEERKTRYSLVCLYDNHDPDAFTHATPVQHLKKLVIPILIVS